MTNWKVIDKALKEKISIQTAKENLELEIEEAEKETRDNAEYLKSLRYIGIEVLR